MKRILAREWLWLLGSVAAALVFSVIFVGVIGGEVDSALVGGIYFTPVFYVASGAVRLIVWAIRTIRSSPGMPTGRQHAENDRVSAVSRLPSREYARYLALGAALSVVVIAVYIRTTEFGLVSDDYDWLERARSPGLRQIWGIEGRDQFYRPIVGSYFKVALAICGSSMSCFHWFSIGLHWTTSMAAAGFAVFLSGRFAVGALTGMLFAVQPAPVEAVAWVGAVGEVLAAGFFVLTLWLYRLASSTNRGWPYLISMVTFAVCLLSHESGVMLLPVIVVGLWLLPVREHRTIQALRLLPFAVMLAVYLLIAYSINSKSSLITEGTYALGWHVVTNTLGALVSFTVARREVLGLVVLGIGFAWVVVFAPPRMRFFALWVVLTLLPSTLFRLGFSSRYHYLPGIGFAALSAELLWVARSALQRWPSGGAAGWWLATVFLTARFGVFAAGNVQSFEQGRVPYDAYAAEIRRLYPTPPSGARLEVPPPPESVPERYVEPLLRWTYEDSALTVSFQEDNSDERR